MLDKKRPVKPVLEILPATAALLRSTLVILESRRQEHAALAEQINARAAEVQAGMAALDVRIAELKTLLDEAQP